jgi:DNA-binding transcriptional ArsR family regulator
MKAFRTIKDPLAFQLLADETRRKIVYLLRVKEMSVSQLASELNLTPQAVYHHVKKLVKGGLAEVTREERCGHLIESHYRATAELFNLSHGKASAQSLRSKQLAKEQMTKILEALEKAGFALEYDEEKISQLVDVQSEQNDCCHDTSRLENIIYEMNDLDLLNKKTAVSLAKNLKMTDEEFQKEHEKRKKFRQALMTLLKKEY